MKYRYFKDDLPGVGLISGGSGVIEVVHFYPGYDYLRRETKGNEVKGFSWSMVDLVSSSTPHILEYMDDSTLDAVIWSAKMRGQILDLDELKEIRELEKQLRRTIGNYRFQP